VTTKIRNLRTGRSIWQGKAAPKVRCLSLYKDAETDVLVVGAGITGAMVTDELVTAGLDVMVADRRGPADGSTTASTALVQYEIDTPLTKLIRKIGKRDATRAWRRSRLAVDALGARLRELGVADATRRNTLYLAGNLLNRDELEREHDARRASGIAGEFLNRTALRDNYGIGRAAALLGFDNFTIDPRKTTLALLRQAAKRGARVYAPLDIADVQAGRRGVTATAANGRTISCRHLVFATGYELPKAVPKRGHKIISTYVIATGRQRRKLWPGEATIWEASDPYLYLRTSPDGRVICGGEDEDFSDAGKRDALLPRKAKTLQRKLKKLLPHVDSRIEFAWCGTFGESATGLPTIGEIPRMPNCYVALGYGGNGITYARIAADVIRGALTGRPDVDADLYDFPRPS
jgi:glycine/D-amino acid oxidase-like deaminating enzyme